MDPRFFRKYSDLITEAEKPQQLDEGIIDSIKQVYQSLSSAALAIPNFKQYYDLAKTKQQDALEAIKTSKTPEELEQKIQQIADAIPLSEAYKYPKPVMPSAAGAGAFAAASLYATWAAKVIGVYSSVAAYAAGGQIGMAVAGGFMFGIFGQLGALGIAIALAMKAAKAMKSNREQGLTALGNQPKQQPQAQAKAAPKAAPTATAPTAAPVARTATPNYGGGFTGYKNT